MNAPILQFFTQQDLQCKCGCKSLRLMPGFLTRLVELQEALGFSLEINSCCRCPEHNANVGGHPRSLHQTLNAGHGLAGTCAIDLRLPVGHAKRQKVWDTAWKLGWSIGDNPRFLHIDRRSDYIKYPQAVFKY